MHGQQNAQGGLEDVDVDVDDAEEEEEDRVLPAMFESEMRSTKSEKKKIKKVKRKKKKRKRKRVLPGNHVFSASSFYLFTRLHINTILSTKSTSPPPRKKVYELRNNKQNVK